MKLSDLLFSISAVGIITAGFITALVSQDDINEYENRYMNSMDKLTVSGYLDGSFQSSIEPALADKVNFAIPLKKSYNALSSLYLKNAVALTVTDNGDRYIKMGDISLFGGSLVREIFTLSEYGEAIDKNLQSYFSLIKKHPDTDFYFYYIERDTDINFETGEKNGVFEKIVQNGGFENAARFEVNDFAYYKENFYSTDHHWNADGAHRGYEDVLKLLKIDDEAIKKGERVELASFSGSKAVGDTAGYSEIFFAYRYSFPDMKIAENGKIVSDYGKRDWYIAENPSCISYGDYYGGDIGELVFDTGNTERDNLLVIGESYDNAILKLLATHFNKTHSIDLRYYEALMGKSFDFASYIEENNIDKVLFIGSIGFVRSEDFIVN